MQCSILDFKAQKLNSKDIHSKWKLPKCSETLKIDVFESNIVSKDSNHVFKMQFRYFRLHHTVHLVAQCTCFLTFLFLKNKTDENFCD